MRFAVFSVCLLAVLIAPPIGDVAQSEDCVLVSTTTTYYDEGPFDMMVIEFWLCPESHECVDCLNLADFLDFEEDSP